MRNVTYIGRRPTFYDNLYGSKLTFNQGQTVSLPNELAKKFLSHVDQFTEHVNADDVVDKFITDVQYEEKGRVEKESMEEQLQAIRDSIATMDKEALKEFAQVNYRMTLDGRMTVEKMRQEATNLVDLYGIQ